MIIATAHQEDIIERAGLALRHGKLVIFPTETVYGIGAAADNPHAVARLYEVKNRPKFNPLIVHCANQEMAFKLVKVTKLAKQLGDAFWPGPMSLVLTCLEDSPICALARAGLDSIALRVPSNPICQKLLEVAGIPVVAPSANPSGKLSPTNVKHLEKELIANCAAVIDAGRCSKGIESTIIDARNEMPVLLRQGPITKYDINTKAKLQCLFPEQTVGQKPIAPGLLASHYAPSAELRLNANQKQPGEIFIGFDSPTADFNLTSKGDLLEAAANLFDMLHLADKQKPVRIAIAPIPNNGIGEAINERLARAAAPRNVPTIEQNGQKT